MQRADPVVAQRWHTWLACLAIVGVTGLAVAVVNELGHRSDAARLAAATLARINYGAQTLNALEWQTISRGELTPELRGKVAGARQAMQDEFERLGPAHPELASVRESYATYLHLLDQEFRLLADSDIESARALDESQVDPAFDKLTDALRDAGTVFDAQAVAVRDSVYLWNVAVLSGAMLIVGAIVWMFLRLQRIAAVARAEERISRQSGDTMRQLNAGLERRIEERTADLKVAVEDLERFAYTVAHDLRAPLRHIHGYAGMLGESMVAPLADDSQRYLKMIGDTSIGMSQMIDGLLDFSRVGRAALTDASISLEALVRDAIRGLELATNGRNIEWTIAPLPPVRGDPAVLKEVLSNLVGNAVKYTRQRDPARIEIGCAGEENGRLIVFVRDNGAGFDVQFVDKLFGVFQRLHTAAEFEGTGIGLAIVHRIVERHGGRTWAEGKVGEGATFYFTLAPATAG